MNDTLTFVNVYFILRLNDIDKGAELTAALVNMSVDLKFFPDAPIEKEAINRVSPSHSIYVIVGIYSQVNCWICQLI